ncbi:MAG: DUF3810 domain-containing protein [Flavobacteriaceae bacterium]|nr:DUF3810 domain-containing protein [Flavobacteriaceae bacterium]
MNKLNNYNKNYLIKWLLAISFPFQFILIQKEGFLNSTFFHFYVDNYKYISDLRTSFFSFFLISIGDIFYSLFVVLSIVYFLKNKSYYFNYKTRFFIDIISVLSFINIFFQLSWGLNYQSQPLEIKLKIDKSYSEEDLEKTISYLIFKTNYLHKKLSKNDTSAIKFPFNKKEARLLLEDEDTGIVKNSLWNTPLSYMGYSGYINPFTLEAQVNAKIPMISYLTTIAHEQSHQKGVAAENESNYWAFKNTSTNKNPYVKYAGYSFALRYCMSNLYKRNSKKARILSEEIFPGVKKNFNDINEFWKKYQNPFEPIFKKTYDKFLKINNQKSGIASYNEMVSLVIFDLKNDINSQKK